MKSTEQAGYITAQQEAAQSEQEKEFTKKTLLGNNAEKKRVIELSIEEIEDVTGIPRDEMFGTEAGGERVVYVGAPWQARKIFDSKRLFVVDYEYGEIATFCRNFGDIKDKVDQILYDGYYSLEGTHDSLIEQRDDNAITAWEREEFEQLFQEAKAVEANLAQLADYKINEVDEVSVKEELSLRIIAISEKLKAREDNFGDIIRKRELEWEKQEGQEMRDEFDTHIVEDFFRKLALLVKYVSRGLQDIKDYREQIAPALATYEHELTAKETKQDEKTWAERGLKLKQRELSILNELRLKKHTNESHVTVAMFPKLPFAQESMDRLILSYVVSTHTIPQATADDFRLWWAEAQRVLKVGGKAYMFPMQQGFPYGRMYDAKTLRATLDEFSPEHGGQLQYSFYENPNPDAWRQDTTLILNKVARTE